MDQATNAEDVMFDMFKNEETGLLHVGKFLAVSQLLKLSDKKSEFYLIFKFLGTEDDGIEEERPAAAGADGQFKEGTYQIRRSGGHFARDSET